MAAGAARPIPIGVPAVTVDQRQLRQLTSDLRRVSTEMPKQVRGLMLDGAKIVAGDARSRASWSSRIPGTVKPRATARGARVVAGGPKAPHASFYEGTNSGGPGRHPVFARGARSGWRWTSKGSPRPYLKPAAEGKATEVAQTVGDGLLVLFKHAGWQ